MAEGIRSTLDPQLILVMSLSSTTTTVTAGSRLMRQLCCMFTACSRAKPPNELMLCVMGVRSPTTLGSHHRTATAEHLPPLYQSLFMLVITRHASSVQCGLHPTHKLRKVGDGVY